MMSLKKTEALLTEHDLMDGALNSVRKNAYKCYIYEKYGLLGKFNRIKLPQCVLKGIRNKWPYNNGNYMGFKSQ